MSDHTFTTDEVELINWILNTLYNGGSWRSMEAQRPEINDMTQRLYDISSAAERA